MIKVKQTHCWCGQPLLQHGFQYEENLVGVKDGRMIASARNFLGECSIHGKRINQFFGHHSTITEKRLKDEFWQHRGYFKSNLTREDYLFFYDAMHGRASPQEDKLASWRQLLLDGGYSRSG
ncbi:hypothetical protein [Bradyrhizobium sp. URHD0069]|uniref:hypothetical protein n=1 Tax=Bradyrhizobium sp. URHD0069 TaxID=1380355 RepID=UPI000496F3AE|nr:hypothetical protein [Bradyrhizobium sp. URHD0069]